MRYGSVCSGIEAATVAWHPLGWTPAFFSEIEKFPSAVLAHHYGCNMPGEALTGNGVPNLGDMTKFQEWPDADIDVLVGGTPCQSFSVAGLRAGLADPRGNLMLTYLAIAAKYRPRWLVWENVPGVLSSNGGRDFGTFLRGVGELGYGFAYRVLDAQFCRASGLESAVPQRRRRVFVVGYLGDWQRAAAVFFDGPSLRGDSAPRREAGQRVAPTTSSRPTGGGGLGTDFDLDGGLVQEPIVMTERGRSAGLSLETPQDGTANAILTPNGGRGGLGVGAIAFAQNQRDEVREMEVAGALAAEPGVNQQTYVAFSSKDYGADASVDVAPTLRAMGHADSHPNAGGQMAVAFNPKAGGNPTIGKSYLDDGSAYTLDTDCTSVAIAHAIQAGALRENPASGPDGVGVQEGIAYTVEARAEVQAVAWSIMPQNSGKDFKARAVDVAQPIMAGGPVGGNQGGDYIQESWAVRRLTPLECERLQGFPDGYTQIPYRNKPAADGPRYKALGNSMAVNVMRIIGERIAMVEGRS